MTVPKDSEIIKPKFGNVLMELINDDKYSNQSLQTFTTLYKGDSCTIIINNAQEKDLCKMIFSSILTRGIEQSIVQMGIVITSFLDELVSVKSIQQLKNLFANSTNFQSYEAFMSKFLLNAFWKTQDIFEVFREDKKDDILKINNILLVLFIIIDMVIFSFLVYFIYSYVAVLNSFLNFIGILPSKFISDDEALYQNIIQLQEYY